LGADPGRSGCPRSRPSPPGQGAAGGRAGPRKREGPPRAQRGLAAYDSRIHRSPVTNGLRMIPGNPSTAARRGGGSRTVRAEPTASADEAAARPNDVASRPRGGIGIRLKDRQYDVDGRQGEEKVDERRAIPLAPSAPCSSIAISIPRNEGIDALTTRRTS